MKNLKLTFFALLLITSVACRKEPTTNTPGGNGNTQTSADPRDKYAASWNINCQCGGAYTLGIAKAGVKEEVTLSNFGGKGWTVKGVMNTDGSIRFPLQTVNYMGMNFRLSGGGKMEGSNFSYIFNLSSQDGSSEDCTGDRPKKIAL
ncbi:MAG: hypothetical protein M3Q97_03715 [Bacteroidota bacterium]|nr:hypothetical protein [Bacteroidota bacterium]